MSIRNLEFAFKPRSIALIGASERDTSIGRKVLENLVGAGFEGPILPVNPHRDEVLGVPAYSSVADLPSAPDLAVIATPASTVPGLIDELGKRGTRAAVVISAGFAELADGSGAALQKQMLAAAQPHLLRIIGPNCVGIVVPGGRVNASFAHLTPRAGSIAFVTQSGALLTAVLDWADARGIGFSHLLSLGGMADVDFGDALDFLANDQATSAILLYVEAVTHARKFMSAARAAARSKPVIVCKSGRHSEGARAARSHSGALAGSDAVYDAAMRRAGMLRVYALEDLFDAVEMLAIGRHPHGARLAIVTNGGGMGILATDRLIDEGGELAELSDASIAQLDGVLPPAWSHGNPVDIIGDADAARYRATLDTVIADPNVDATLVLNCPVAVASSVASAAAVVDAHVTHRDKPLLTSWVGGSHQRDSRALFAEHRVPSYDTPEDAVRAFMYLVNYQRSQAALLETPPSIPEAMHPDRERARAIVAQGLDRGGGWLDPLAARELIAAYEIPVLLPVHCDSPAAAAAAARRIGAPVALKISSPDISHKTDVGGVILDLADADAVESAAAAMLHRVGALHPDARELSVTVEPMVGMKGAIELIVGAHEDPQFGPVVLFGHGGTAVEVRGDTTLGLPPLNVALARAMMMRTQIFKQLRGYRSLPPANLAAIEMTLLKVSQMLIDLPEVVELDINPLSADAERAIALDARVRVAVAKRPGTARLAIRPYPSELEETITLDDGRVFELRPIRPEDEPALHATFAKLTPEEIRMRFFVRMRQLPHPMAARFTQIDYDREMALVLIAPGPNGELFGVVRIHADPDLERAEFAVLVRHDLSGRGLADATHHRVREAPRHRRDLRTGAAREPQDAEFEPRVGIPGAARSRRPRLHARLAVTALTVKAQAARWPALPRSAA
jgi:acetyltransferase